MRSTEKNWFSAAVRWICSFLLVIYSAAAVFFFAAEVFGYQKYVVVSGSMAPTIPVGACILVKGKETEKIETGEIITFSISEGRTIVTHRVLENQRDKGCFLTKGDANESADNRSVSYEVCIGTVRLIVPVLGFLLVFLNSIYGKAAAASLFLLCIWLLSLVGQQERRTHERNVNKRKEAAFFADRSDCDHSLGHFSRSGICISERTDQRIAECDHHWNH